VSSATPAPNATNIAISSTVNATFNEAVQGDTIVFTLANSAGVSVGAKVSYNSTNYTVTLTPSAALAHGTIYTALVKDAQSSAGVPMNAPFTWSFTTAPTPPTTTAAASASVNFNTGGQDVPLTATVTSPAGPVDEGTVTFTILSGTTRIGSPVTVDVSAGAASASYPLPSGTLAGKYIIDAVYNGTADFGGSSDTSQSLTINAAATITAVASASAPFSDAAQDVSLGATVTSHAGTVNEGTLTVTILSGGSPLGTPLIVKVSAGAASGSYSLPAGTPAGAYTIEAHYNGTANFGSSSDLSQKLNVTAAATTTAAVSSLQF
jgi:Bacterial Ig-like domain (group 3)/Bacterial Ig-like domain